MEAPTRSATPLAEDLEAKYHGLLNFLAGLKNSITAFSGGVDSSLVAYLAYNVLGKRALAVTSQSPSLARDDLLLAKRLAKQWGLNHQIIETAEIDNPDYQANSEQRCYHCKTALFGDLSGLAREHDYEAILDGSNLDDQAGHRPGSIAAGEFGVQSPLRDNGFTKADIRALAGYLGLENADKPATACLASRIPHGIPVTVPVLKQVESAEHLLRELGFGQLRVRHHGDLARIEVMPEALEKVLLHREEIEGGLRTLGYRFVTLDLRGFRSGSLSEGL